MKSLEKRLSDYKLIKSKIKETQNGYIIYEDKHNTIYIEVSLEKLQSDDGKEYFAIRNSLHPIGFLNNLIYSDTKKAMNECYKEILKESLIHLHVGLGLVLKGTDLTEFNPLFEFFKDERGKYDYKNKRELKKNKKKSEIKEPVSPKGREVQGSFLKEIKKVFNYFSPKKEKYSGASADTG